jgi:hypothetical protein
MEVSGAGSVQAALSGVEKSGGEDKRAQLQLMLLKRALDDQKRQAVDAARLIEGKGNTIDIKV